MSSNLHFYGDISKCRLPLHEVLDTPTLFQEVPADWQVLVVDVESSTQAVKNGLHHQVNLAATGSIIAVLNTVKAHDPKLKVPYFFGGDGATFIVPESLREMLLDVLDKYRQHVLRQMYLTLKVGSLPVEDVYEQDRKILITKFAATEVLTIPLVLGTGLKHAERTIKSVYVDETLRKECPDCPDLTGMECRWQEIKPPEEEEQVVCLVVDCQDDVQQGPVYAEVAQEIRVQFGTYQERQPITVEQLKLNLTIKKLRAEMYARIGKFNLGYLLKNWLITVFGKYYFIYFKEGRDYVKKVSQLSYTLMIDGTFNCVLSGTQREIEALRSYLDTKEAQGALTYGIHVTHAAVMSCYVEDRKSKHIHFVDGTEGGFTTAARMFKAKLAAVA